MYAESTVSSPPTRNGANCLSQRTVWAAEYGLDRERLRQDTGFARYTVKTSGGARESQPWDAARLERHFGHSLDVYGTFNRTEALQRPGTAVRRLGEPFVDRLVDLTETDDLGRCFATWRASAGDERLILQCDFRVAPRSAAPAEIRRKAHRYLPEHEVTVYVDLQNGNPVDDSALLEMLDAGSAPR